MHHSVFYIVEQRHIAHQHTKNALFSFDCNRGYENAPPTLPGLRIRRQVAGLRVWISLLIASCTACSSQNNRTVFGGEKYGCPDMTKCPLGSENWVGNFKMSFTHLGVRGDEVGWSTALQVGRSRVRFPMVSLEFLINSGRTLVLGLTQPLTEMRKGKVIPLQARCGPEGG